MSKTSSSNEPLPSTQASDKKAKPKKMKKSHYRDLFNLYFFTIFKRRLTYLYPAYIEENIYILSNTPPYDMLSEQNTEAFALVDLSGADPVFRDLVKNWFKSFLSLVTIPLCIRIDYFAQIVNRYFGDKIIPGQELIPFKGELPPGEYPAIIPNYDVDNETYQYLMSKNPDTDKDDELVPVAWQADLGSTTLVIDVAKKMLQKFLKTDIMYPVGKDFPKGIEEIHINDKIYRFKPIAGIDTLEIEKTPAEGACLAVCSRSSRAIQYGHYVHSDGVHAVLTRPNIVLFPQAFKKI